MNSSERAARAVTGMAPQLAAMSDYDPDSMPVEQARLFIRQFLIPLAGAETVGLHEAFMRTLAADVPSPMDVPPHDYSAMDGYALRHADLQGERCAAARHRQQLRRTSLRRQGIQRRVRAHHDRRAHPGGLRHRGDAGACHGRRGGGCASAAATRPGQNIRRAGEDIRQGAIALARRTTDARRRNGPAGFARVWPVRRFSANCASRSFPPATN